MAVTPPAFDLGYLFDDEGFVMPVLQLDGDLVEQLEPIPIADVAEIESVGLDVNEVLREHRKRFGGASR